MPDASPPPVPSVVLAPLRAPAARPAGKGWRVQVHDAVTAYLPLLLMALLAVGTWWLVKHTPKAADSGPAPAPRHEPDYTMQGFSAQRFASDGSLRIEIEGAQMRHYPDTNSLEIDAVRIHARHRDAATGQTRVTLISASQAQANADATEIALRGGVVVHSQQLPGPDASAAVPADLHFQTEWLQVLVKDQRLQAPDEVEVAQGRTNLRSAGLVYDHAKGHLTFTGPTVARMQPVPPKAAR